MKKVSFVNSLVLQLVYLTMLFGLLITNLLARTLTIFNVLLIILKSRVIVLMMIISKKSILFIINIIHLVNLKSMKNENFSPAEKVQKVNDLKGLAKFFELDLTIKVFGIQIIKFHWPPKNS